MTTQLPICENCGSPEGMRKILWGMPAEEPDLNEFVLGGCILEENPSSLKCIDCGWENNQPRWKRFAYESQLGINILCRSCDKWIKAAEWSDGHICPATLDS
jgi:hypothetical protein